MRIRCGQVFGDSRAATAVVEEDEESKEPIVIQETRTGQGAIVNADDGTRNVDAGVEAGKNDEVQCLGVLVMPDPERKSCSRQQQG
jgi:hypothetical protein